MEINKVSCSACGAPIQIQPDTELINCSYCGANLVIQRSEGYVTPKLAEKMTETIQGAQNWQEELHLVIKGYMEFALENPELYQLCFERPVPGFVPSVESLQVSFGMLHQSYERVSKLLPIVDTDLNEKQVTDLIIAIMHGLTALHIANEPDLPVGEGRFGSLIPAVVSVLDKAWVRK